MKIKKTRAFILLAVTLLFTAFIFSNSAADSEASGNMSDGVVEVLQSIADMTGSGIEVDGALVRKAAHFSEFAALGVLALLTLHFFGAAMEKTGALFWSLACGVADEFIQLYSPGRSSDVRDVVIDFAGALLGTAITALILHAVRARKRRKPESKK